MGFEPVTPVLAVVASENKKDLKKNKVKVDHIIESSLKCYNYCIE